MENTGELLCGTTEVVEFQDSRARLVEFQACWISEVLLNLRGHIAQD